MDKIETYEAHKKLIFKMSWTCALKFHFEVEEIVSEFNIVFCESFNNFNPECGTKFSSFFCSCCWRRMINMNIKRNRKKRKSIIQQKDYDTYADIISHNPMDSIIIYDNFINNENEVIRKIARIISIYTLPKKSNIKGWLRLILQDTFNNKEITEAFAILRTIYETA